jgi:hypothetical protein
MVARITFPGFAAKNKGVSTLSIESAILSTRDAEEIPYTKQEGGIGVNASGQAPDMDVIANPTTLGQGTVNTSRLTLAGLSIFVFLTALGVFIYLLRHKR